MAMLLVQEDWKQPIRAALIACVADPPGVIKPALKAQARHFARAEEIPMQLVFGAQRAQGARFSGAEGGRGRAARCLGRGRLIHAGSPFPAALLAFEQLSSLASCAG